MIEKGAIEKETQIIFGRVLHYVDDVLRRLTGGSTTNMMAMLQKIGIHFKLYTFKI